jgi:signal transduction histidine kinase
MRSPLALSTRILLPIVVAFLAVLGGTIGLTLHLVGDAEERALDAQVEKLRGLPDGLFQPESIEQLRFLRDLVGAELVITDARGQVAVTTRPSLAKRVAASTAVADETGEAYRIFRRPLRSGATLVAFLPERAIDERKWELARPVIAASAIGLVAMAIVAILLGRGLAKSMRRMAGSASALSKDPAAGELPLLGVREIDELALAFNSVVREWRASQVKLVAAEKMALLGRLSAVIAHEVRNPLSAIRLTTQLLLRRTPEGDARTREALERILGEIQRLEMAVEDLLQTAKPSPLALAPVAANLVVEESLRLLDAQCRHLRVDVRASLGAGLPDVTADAARLKQVVLNLVLNAIHAAGPEGAVEIETRESAGGVRLAVRDSGKGVDASVRERLFEPFVTTKESGAGLGLYVSKQIVEEHGGRLGLAVSGGRTEFFVELPARVAGAKVERV